MEKKRVVITGIGPVTSIGIGKDEFLASLQQCKSGISPIERIGSQNLVFKYGGEIKDFEFEKYGFDSKSKKRLDLLSQFALVGTKLALEDSKLNDYYIDSYDKLIRFGVGFSGTITLSKEFEKLIAKGSDRISSFTIPKVMPNSAACNPSIYNNIKGESSTINAACASALYAIADCYDKILLDRCKIAVTGGVEACMVPFVVAPFVKMKAMTLTLGEDGLPISRPYDKNRDGFVMGEGAGVLILEELGHALSRDAPIYAEILGYGTTSDANNIVAPHPEADGLVRAIEDAIKRSGISKTDIAYINSHGTSTELNDRSETIAFKKVFGSHAYDIPISSTKSMIGHAIGAAAGIELIASLLGMQNGFIHPTINLNDPDPELDLDYVPNKIRFKEYDVFMKTSLGFGGHNAAIIIKKYKP